MKSEYERESDRNLTLVIVALLAASVCLMITAIMI